MKKKLYAKRIDSRALIPWIIGHGPVSRRPQIAILFLRDPAGGSLNPAVAVYPAGLSLHLLVEVALANAARSAPPPPPGIRPRATCGITGVKGSSAGRPRPPPSVWIRGARDPSPPHRFSVVGPFLEPLWAAVLHELQRACGLEGAEPPPPDPNPRFAGRFRRDYREGIGPKTDEVGSHRIAPPPDPPPSLVVKTPFKPVKVDGPTNVFLPPSLPLFLQGTRRSGTPKTAPARWRSSTGSSPVCPALRPAPTHTG